ncbi:hypothetical protein ABZP36_025522 [Zizania latifolia]
MFDDVNKYWMSHLNFSKYLAIFRLKHLRNPWTCISLLGAILLVIFSFTSMIIAILNFLNGLEFRSSEPARRSIAVLAKPFCWALAHIACRKRKKQ